MTLTMTLIYATLAFLGGSALAYVWQRMRIRQVEAQAQQLATDLSFAEAWGETYRQRADQLATDLSFTEAQRETYRQQAEAALDTLHEIRLTRREAGIKAWVTRLRKGEVSDVA